MADLVIAEGVELELRPARLASRFMGWLLDALIQSVLFVVFIFATLALTSGSGTSDATHALVIVALVLVTIGYPTLSETLSTGKSIGKAAAGLRVVRVDGGPERFRHALARALAGMFADLNLPLFAAILFGDVPGPFVLMIGLPGAVVSVMSRRGQRIGDLLAGTMVVRERMDISRGSAPIPPPPMLTAWAAGATVGNVPTGLIVAARQLISRIFELDRRAAAELANELARQFSPYVKPAPPEGTPAYQYLVAVTGERFRRETGAVFGGLPYVAVPAPALMARQAPPPKRRRRAR
jgi:uncharacterized RDD family membrane protein YckC